MPGIKKTVELRSDEKTQEYILGLMKSLPEELFQLVRELRGITEIIRRKTDRLDQDSKVLVEDLGKLFTRLDALEDVVRELCDTASKAMAVEPLWKIMQDK